MNVNQASKIVELAMECQKAQSAYIIQCAKGADSESLATLNAVWDESMKVFMDYTFNLVDE